LLAQGSVLFYLLDNLQNARMSRSHSRSFLREPPPHSILVIFRAFISVDFLNPAGLRLIFFTAVFFSGRRARLNARKSFGPLNAGEAWMELSRWLSLIPIIYGAFL
ncbi:hypothetical protein, partial [Methanothrix soehngenii]|uniref:hypothetical protein n=1 Tax=Methanothrix soehngenii TaxID=2223 RepID=UPI002A363256